MVEEQSAPDQATNTAATTTPAAADETTPDVTVEAAAQDSPAPESAAERPTTETAAPDSTADEEAGAEQAGDEPTHVEPAAADQQLSGGSAPALEEAVIPARPAPPRPPVPSPAALAARIGTARPAPPATTADHSESARFGRVAEDGTVFVRRGTDEIAVGSYPGAGPDEALQYFARKYDELYGMTELLEQRLTGSSELTAKDAAEQLTHLSEQAAEPTFVGDLEALHARLESIGILIDRRREEESAQRAAAKATALAEREALVVRAENIAAQDPQRTQWKRSGEELRTLFEEWKAHQRSGARLDKPVEAELWHRFSAARGAFDKARRAHFSELEASQSEAKAAKESLVREAEQLSGSRDWGPTAREFKRLMDRWRAAGRAGRADDDALWARFKAAQDAFFAAKDEVAAAEDQEFRANLAVKEQLLAEAEGLLPIRDLEATKSALRSIQDRWDRAGKVPRADIDRTEKGIRRVEQAVRDAEQRQWSSSNPEARARAQSLVEQLERAVADLERDLANAEAKGNDKKAAEARSAIQGRQALLDQARSALTEFS
ncbi:DUF349 domain-containing protein [Nostocoides sp. F2B08]|nr:DUF349 domain-containing protein [Tetrasphaera sp. F2B08]